MTASTQPTSSLATPPLAVNTDPIEQVPVSPAYAAIQLCFAHCGSAHHYHRDVSHHDRATLAHNPPRFMWLLGACFTNVLLEASQTTAEILDYRLNERRSGEAIQAFGYEYGALRPLNHDQARAFHTTLPRPVMVESRAGLTFLSQNGQTRQVCGEHLVTLNLAQQTASAHVRLDHWDCRATVAFDQTLAVLWQALDMP